MFFWLKLDALKHPKFHSEFKGSVPDLEMHLYNGVIKQGTLLIPGNWFIVDDKSPEKEGKDEPQSNLKEIVALFTLIALERSKIK